MGRIAKSVMYGLIFAVVFVWLFLLMSRHANRGPIALSGNRRPSSEGVNRSTEPFGVKANDVLGIRLGMALYDYRRGRRNHSVDCSKEDADTQVLCIGSQLNRHEPKLTVGGVDVEHYSLRFYEQRLIDIRYELVSSSWDSLKESLQDKFGPPAKHGGAGSGGMGSPRCCWTG